MPTPLTPSPDTPTELSPNPATGENQFGKFISTGRKTDILGLRIFADQKEKLNLEYQGTASALVRLLLEEYFSGALALVEAKFKNSIK